MTLRRRSFLGGLVAASVGVLVPHGQLPALAAARASAPRASGKIVARQIDHVTPLSVGTLQRPSGQHIDVADVGSTGGETLSLTSPVIDAGQLFERVAAHFRAAPGTAGAALVEVRASPDGTSWTDWLALPIDEHLTDAASSTYYLPPQPVPASSRFAQYRVWLAGSASALEHFALTVMDVNDLNVGPVARLFRAMGGALADAATAGYAMAAPIGPPRILTRQDWGADETLMKWTPKYVPAQKALVHHTVTDDGGTNVAATIRSIYYFHAVTRGWGDIGYNFIVDKFGNIWTGRQGGDNVVAGHAYGWNDGTIGIASLGDYSVAAPTSQLQGAIAAVVSLKMKQLGIQPFGNGVFTHEEQKSDGSWIKVTTSVANMLGHRDCSYVVGQTGGQTACPGGPIYNMLNGLRSLAQTSWQNGYTTLYKIDPQLASGGVPGQLVNVPVAVTNLGSQPIPAGTLVNYRILRNGTAIATGPGAPIAQALAPGALVTVMSPFLVPAIGEYVVRWDLHSGGTWWSQIYSSPVRDQWFRAADWSANWIDDTVSRLWTAGEVRSITVTVQNDGGRTWPATGTNPVRLGYYWLSTATGNRTDGPTKQALPFDVAPGQTITLTIPVVAPAWPTNYTMILDLWKENEFWFKDKGLTPDDTETTVLTDFKAAYAIGALPPFTASKTVTVPVTITDLGRGTFPTSGSYPVTLGYHWADPTGNTVVWDGARTLLPGDLLSQQSVTVPAQVTPPDKGGGYQLRFDLVQEGQAWFSAKGVAMGTVAVAVEGPVVPVYGATYQPLAATLGQSGGLAAAPVTLINRSNFTWPAQGSNPVTLSYHWLSSGQMAAWDGARTKLTADVPPGGSITLNAQVVFPQQQGTYALRWDLVHEGISWFSGKGVATLDQSVVVGPPPFYGGSIDVSQVPPTMPARMRTAVPLKVQNMSNFAWDTGVNLSYHWLDPSGRVVQWDGVRTPLAGQAPNDLRSILATVEAPATPGAYTLKFDIVREGVTWFSSQGMLLAPIAVAVQVPTIGALYGEPAQASGAPTATIAVPIGVTNVGVMTWTPGQVNLSYHLYTAQGALVAWDGARTAIPQAVATGQQAMLNATIRLPATPGAYTIKWDLVQEGITWFSGQGVTMDQTALLVS